MLQAARTMPDTLAHPAAADARPDLIVVQGVSKRFGSTAALQDVSLRGRAGSIHAITGENGAGKSTLMKLLAGVHQPDAGEIRMAGQRLQLRSPAAARAAGISTVFQELTVLPNLTVAENLVLGREPRRAGLLDHAAIHDGGAGRAVANRHHAGSAAQRCQPHRRRAAAGGDRQGREHRCAGVHLRRTDRAAEPRRGRQAGAAAACR
jgi:ABC-type branched-subunit amino acid transport system ATPase component